MIIRRAKRKKRDDVERPMSNHRDACGGVPRAMRVMAHGERLCAGGKAKDPPSDAHYPPYSLLTGGKSACVRARGSALCAARRARDIYYSTIR